MTGKLCRLWVVVAVVCLALPAFASAAPEVTVNGVRAIPGTVIVGHSTNDITKTTIGNIQCHTKEFGAELTKNTGTTFAGVGIGLFHATICTYKNGPTVTVSDPTILSLHSGTAGSGTISFTYTATIAHSLTCHYFGSAIPFTYSATGHTINIKGGLTTSPPACGTASTEGTYTFSSPGGAVVLH